MTPLVAPESVEDTAYCATCLDTCEVPHWAPHDGRDQPDKRGRMEMRMVPCPDCTRTGARHGREE